MNDALFGPVVVGLNLTLTVQLAPAARPAPPIGQALVLENCAGFNPVIPMLLMTTAVTPVLLTVTV